MCSADTAGPAAFPTRPPIASLRSKQYRIHILVLSWADYPVNPAQKKAGTVAGRVCLQNVQRRQECGNLAGAPSTRLSRRPGRSPLMRSRMLMTCQAPTTTKKPITEKNRTVLLIAA